MTPGGEGTPYPGKWVVDASKEEIIEQYAGWEQEVQVLNQVTIVVSRTISRNQKKIHLASQCVAPCTRWAIHTMDALPFSVDGHVALLGDSVRVHYDLTEISNSRAKYD